MESKMKKWRVLGQNKQTNLPELLNLNDITTISFRGPKEVTMANGSRFTISDVDFYLITEGDSWFKNHKSELTDEEYNNYEKQYQLDIANHNR